jgi:hypothetical protein
MLTKIKKSASRDSLCGNACAMATKRSSRLCAFKIALLAILAMGCYPVGLLVFHWARADVNGDRPRDVAKAFIDAVQSNDFAKAASFWGPGTIQNVEANFEMKFKDFCILIFKVDSYKLGITTRQKEGSFSVPFKGSLTGTNKAWGLYLEVIDSKWRIIEDLWMPATTNSPPPHAWHIDRGSHERIVVRTRTQMRQILAQGGIERFYLLGAVLRGMESSLGF